MARESVHKKLSRVRKPRVQITYDVQVGESKEQKDLPFVVGVLADLSGQPAEPLAKLKDRKFTQVDGENFDQVLAGCKPRVNCAVPNKITDDNSSISVNLEFRSMDDFTPEAVAQQVEPIRQLVEARRRLYELSLKVNQSEALDDLLQNVVKSTEALKGLAGEKEEK